MARSLLPFTLCMFGSCHRVRASSTVNQFPSRMPSFFAPFTRRMPAASSGLRSPVSAASYASRRTAASRTLIVPGAAAEYELYQLSENWSPSTGSENN